MSSFDLARGPMGSGLLLPVYLGNKEFVPGTWAEIHEEIPGPRFRQQTVKQTDGSKEVPTEG
jgi:hypothetical protein